MSEIELMVLIVKTGWVISELKEVSAKVMFCFDYFELLGFVPVIGVLAIGIKNSKEEC